MLFLPKNTLMRKALIAIIFAVLSIVVVAQQASISMQNLSTVKVDDLNDDQVVQFWTQAQAGGLTMDKLEVLAKQRKMPDMEFSKLKARIEKIAAAPSSSEQNDQKQSERMSKTEQDATKDKDKLKSDLFAMLKPKIFGADLFNNKNLTFEPNLKIATPQNYQLGPDDELVIDVYGNSEVTHRLKVSPEGSVRIPLVGPVAVSGLTIEQAKARIISQLTSIYSGIATGETSVNITLGNIRSIKVVLLGEISMPGSYTLPSLATVFNALYVSGGPNESGSFRNIKVIRANKVIATVDVYEFLMKGEAKGNIRLEDQDVIKVSPYDKLVELSGEIKRPGLYEAAKSETLSDMVAYAGGFTDNAYKELIKVFRNTSKEKSVADVSLDVSGQFVPQSGDVYKISKLLTRYANRVQINGAVFRPGVFALEDGMTVGKLIKKADGLKEDAFTDRAIIYRLKDDNSTEVLSVNVGDVLKGKDDILLKREDIVQVASRLELRDEYTVTINGEVQKPGTYKYGQNMKVEDLIIAAGGLREAASKRVEIARRIRNSDPKSASADVATIISYEIDRDHLQSKSDIVLMPFDNVQVFQSPGYATQKMVRLEGEVLYPGLYTISNKNEHISDLLKRAGGLTAQAFPEGATLIRTTRLSDIDQLIKEKKTEAISKQSSDTLKAKKLSEVELVDLPSVVGIDLPKILKRSGSVEDLLLEDKDVIRIPKLLQTVQVSGEVLYPVKVRYEKGNRLNAYVNEAGGFTVRSLKKRSYVVYANGTAASTKHFLFFNFYPRVTPGSEVIIPVREERKKVSALEIASIATSATTLVFLLITIIPKL
jgi:protein involved in polysaccharide export with SLBB domain